MGETTKIEWADASWNPWWGCTKVSPGCTNCYAEAHANRFGGGLWRGNHRRIKNWTLPRKLDRSASSGRGWSRRARLFVASMADLFEDHPGLVEWRAEALRLLATLRAVDVLLLTKRPQNVLRMVPPEWLDAWPAHVWIGTTVEDQQRAEERLPHLLQVPARVRFVSYEPALGPVDFAPWFGLPEDEDGAPYPGSGLSWVIAGGESGPRARSSHPDWFRSVRDQCKAAGVPFFMKQITEAGRKVSIPDDLSIREWPC